MVVKLKSIFFSFFKIQYENKEPIDKLLKPPVMLIGLTMLTVFTVLYFLLNLRMGPII